MEAKIFKVKKMHCKACETLIRDILADENIIVDEISFKSGYLKISYDENTHNIENTYELLRNEGYVIEK